MHRYVLGSLENVYLLENDTLHGKLRISLKTDMHFFPGTTHLFTIQSNCYVVNAATTYL